MKGFTINKEQNKAEIRKYIIFDANDTPFISIIAKDSELGE